tara:strand:+ start:220 stop:417 length:198 start_codon:yes stop_codon:yes gene_type:complete
VFEAIVWQESLYIAFSNKGDIVENRKFDNDIKHFGKTGGFNLLFLKKTAFYIIKCSMLFRNVWRY